MVEFDPLLQQQAARPVLSNRLSEHSTPYLRLHQHHPVAWQSWSESTLLLAKKYNTPILLSIGYSSCHWCHVMSRDSFEDLATAKFMNENFINICVDREERPDLDDVYQVTHLLLRGYPGGWPLIKFLCPQTLMPFFASTYTPQQAAEGELGFPQLLEKVHHYYQQQPDNRRSLVAQLRSEIERISLPANANGALTDSLLLPALSALSEYQDGVSGGFGSAPKFPQPVNLMFLLSPCTEPVLADQQREHLRHSLSMIAERGINDRISGGFFRYSVDAGWTTPHFEKMLYDNGLLLEVYANAHHSFGDSLYKSASLGIVRWLRHFMLSSEGAFYSSMDADAGQAEGGHYRLNIEDIRSSFSAEEFQLYDSMFALEVDSSSQGGCHFSQVKSLSDSASELLLERDDALGLYLHGRAKLELLRQANPAAAIDEKILLSWNATVIKGLAVSARCGGPVQHLSMAQSAVDFIAQNMWINKRLFGCWYGGKVLRHALLDDYAYLMDALLELLQAEWRDSDYRLLLAVTESMLQYHQDSECGGFYYTANDAEKLILRSKPFMDSVLPSANGIAARALLRVGHLSAEPRYLLAANGILRAAAEAMQHSPATHLSLVLALEEMLNPLPLVMMVDNGEMEDWASEVESHFYGRVLSFRLPMAADLCPPDLLDLEPGEAIVCVGEECLPAQRDLAGLLKLLQALPQLQS